jgi:hypothetical protein
MCKYKRTMNSMIIKSKIATILQIFHKKIRSNKRQKERESNIKRRFSKLRVTLKNVLLNVQLAVDFPFDVVMDHMDPMLKFEQF